MDVIQTTGLTKYYGRSKVVDQVHLRVHQGDIYGFIGRNGSGKSTTLKMISGLVWPDAGDIELFGQKHISDHIRRRMGVLVEEAGIYPNFSAYHNLLFKAELMGLTDARQRVGEVIERLGLKNVGKKKVKTFSMGMKQRLGIALAIVGKPDLLILDEPINGLDPEGISDIRHMIVKLNEEEHMTILISSHILGELSKIATCYGIIKDGQLIEQMTDEQLREKCQDYMYVRVDQPKKASVLLEQRLGLRNYQIRPGGEIRIFGYADTAAVNTAFADGHVAVKSLYMHAMDLETYFLERMGGEYDV